MKRRAFLSRSIGVIGSLAASDPALRSEWFDSDSGPALIPKPEVEPTCLVVPLVVTKTWTWRGDGTGFTPRLWEPTQALVTGGSGSLTDEMYNAIPFGTIFAEAAKRQPVGMGCYLGQKLIACDYYLVSLEREQLDGGSYTKWQCSKFYESTEHKRQQHHKS